MTQESAAKRDTQRLQRAIVDGLEDVKAQDIVVFNTEHLSPLFERVVVASGTSNRQTKSLAASVRDAVRDAGGRVLATEASTPGGTTRNTWPTSMRLGFSICFFNIISKRSSITFSKMGRAIAFYCILTVMFVLLLIFVFFLIDEVDDEKKCLGWFVQSH